MDLDQAGQDFHSSLNGRERCRLGEVVAHGLDAPASASSSFEVWTAPSSSSVVVAVSFAPVAAAVASSGQDAFVLVAVASFDLAASFVVVLAGSFVVGLEASWACHKHGLQAS